MTTIFETPRLRVRSFTVCDDDADLLVALNADPEVTKYVGEGAVTRAFALDVLRDRIVRQRDAYGVGRWAVERLGTTDGKSTGDRIDANGAFIGWAGFRYEADADHYDLGYRFLRSAWGQGYGREVAAACMQWARTHLAGKTIVGRARVENIASLKILRGVGLAYIGDEDDLDGVVSLFSNGVVSNAENGGFAPPR